jgi:hypothetical protein
VAACFERGSGGGRAGAGRRQERRPGRGPGRARRADASGLEPVNKVVSHFSIYLRREVAKRAGLSQRALRDHARLSFAKVAEYQKRGAVHFHAVIRIDGPGGGDTPPPAWATVELLTDAIQAATPKAQVAGPVIDGRAHTFAFGDELDVRPIRSADFNGSQELTDRAVAAYIAKYATKGAETATGALDRPIRLIAEIAHLDITDHARRLIRTAWALGARKDLEHLRLRA